MKRTYVFIDGGNFYFKLKSLLSESGKRESILRFDFSGFFQAFSCADELIEIRYYVGAIKQQNGNEKSEKMYADQQRLLAKLREQKVVIILGQLIQHPDKTYHEKGVDVRLAVEMIRFARQDKYDTACLVSSDTDLVPAVEEVRSFGKNVQYIGIAKGQSYGLSKASNDVRLLRFEDIEPFFTR